MVAAERTVDAVHWVRRFVIDTAGVFGDITSFYDSEGIEVDGVTGATFAVVRWRDTQQLSRLHIADFVSITTH